ncbi:MAG TPA: DNA alkylation repair protein [Opitutaceae bacterium]|nr:DNA alkylation repair protein [Opitutaceae bacterium]
MSTAGEIVAHLRTLRSPPDVAAQRRYGIIARGEQLGIRAPVLRDMARRHRRDHMLALALWETAVHEARIIATLVDDPRQVTCAQMERWIRGCDNWAVTDACCSMLFDRTPFAITKAHVWSRRRAEFVKRGGFVLMAGLAVHRRELPDGVLLAFLPDIRREAGDGRNFVKKAVNWALRQIGKRNPRLRRAAIATARKIRRSEVSSARWIAADALREWEKINRKRQPRVRS